MSVSLQAVSRIERNLLGLGPDDAHALPSASGARLDEHGVSDLVGLGLEEARVLVVSRVAGDEGDGGVASQVFLCYFL